MFIDSRTVSSNDVITTDVCVVGAGPAGLTVARELIGRTVDVCLVESGGLDVDADVASLADGDSTGDPFPPLRNMRHRQYGGMSNRWEIRIRSNQLGVRYAPLDPIDFEPRAWVPHSGWPFRKEHLTPYYVRAQAVCGLGPFQYGPEAWETGEARRAETGEGDVVTSMFQFGPRDVYLADVRRAIDAAGNVRTYLHATLAELQTDEGGNMVRRAHFACLTGTRFTVEAKVFVLAMGAIENARVLLLSDRQQRRGLGNSHDVVGRYYMDHPLVATGTLHPYGADVFRRMTLYDLRLVNDVPVMGKFQLSCAAMRRERLLNMSAIVLPRGRAVRDTGERSEATVAAKALLSSARNRRWSRRTIELLATIATHPGDVINDLYRYKVKSRGLVPDLDQGGWSLLDGLGRRFTRFEVLSQTEQAPDPENRVILDAGRDRLGLARPRLLYRWSEHDRASIRRAQHLFARAFARAGLGRLEIESNDDSPRVLSLSTHHCMGTTRMHEDPRRGVVDADGRVHAVANLFVTGSSVFPTGGFANPTLTIVALAIRLADHVKAQLGRPAATAGAAQSGEPSAA